MGPEPTTLWSFVAHASLIVKMVIFLLFLASITSWTIIIQRVFFVKRTRCEMKKFEHLFWSGLDLTMLYNRLSEKKDKLIGMSSIFYAGFTEFTRLRQGLGSNPKAILEGTYRAMRITQSREADLLERNLSFLATIGSTSPYVGLFGTVWGIMTSFRSLGAVQQVTIAMVAPGISEALIATAVGLFAAIPAVIAYNQFSNELNAITQNYDTFQEEILNILHRRAYKYKLGELNAKATVS
ncbi:protein TolQ [Coxiella endosymbiont of Ornithodoros amblus]|uniref:protein TolQ n=1 Tax=Coxiella endosymbiont of Ornithodoros amblus TaxID=1656166 RepID=UPI00244DCF56|nr:protein TolQ [Coxiella endosymbiont of Ornithodoros amblus]MBW5803064.1 protein TolQ [Coxiella endosymbiont of Ornithodoros amblus]